MEQIIHFGTWKKTHHFRKAEVVIKIHSEFGFKKIQKIPKIRYIIMKNLIMGDFYFQNF